MLLCALAFWGFGLYVLYQENFVYANWEQVKGEITHLKTYNTVEKKGDEPTPHYDFNVTYEYKGNIKTENRLNFTGKPRFQLGDTYPVSVNPENSNEIRVSDGGEKSLLFVCFAGGALFMFIHLASIFFKRRKSTKLADAPKA